LSCLRGSHDVHKTRKGIVRLELEKGSAEFIVGQSFQMNLQRREYLSRFDTTLLTNHTGASLESGTLT
jgi:hypothetical protein